MHIEEEESSTKVEHGETDYFLNADKTDKFLQVPDFHKDESTKPKRILICAPSNAAIDQIIKLLRFEKHLLRINYISQPVSLGLHLFI